MRRHVRGPLWEMRLVGKAGMARAPYVTVREQRVVILRPGYQNAVDCADVRAACRVGGTRPFFLASLTIGALCAPVSFAAQTGAPAAPIRDVAGNLFALPVRGDGSVVGSNSAGELGVGTRATGWTAAEVTGLSNIVAIAAGMGQGTYDVSAAVRQDGTLWVWGSGSSAMMGNGVRNPTPDEPGGRNLMPLQVKGIAGAKGAAVGAGHIAALLNDGSLRAWGMNGYGELGLGATSSYEVVPVRVPGLTNVAAVRLGGDSSYAIRSDGTL